MDNQNSFNPAITAQKAAIPALGVVFVNVLILILHNNNITIDDTTVWTVCGSVYTGAVALFNWMKNKGK